MTYSIGKLSELAGVSPRTLRWYEQHGLLQPSRQANGYRSYGKAELERLQQILFYRELGFGLTVIQQLLNAPDYDSRVVLEEQLVALFAQRHITDWLIELLQ